MTLAQMTSAEVDAWEAELRSCIGIKWRHMGRCGLPYGHQTGLDCVGLLIRGAAAVGRNVDDLSVYAYEPDGTLETRLCAHLGEGSADIAPAMIVLIRMVGLPSHVGYVTKDGTLIHAYNGGTGVVVEHPLGMWSKRIVRGWKI